MYTKCVQKVSKKCAYRIDVENINSFTFEIVFRKGNSYMTSLAGFVASNSIFLLGAVGIKNQFTAYHHVISHNTNI